MPHKRFFSALHHSRGPLTNSQSSGDLYKRSNGQGTNVSTAAAALLSKTRAPSPSLSTAACEKTNYSRGALLGGKHDPTVRCQNAKGLIDSPALNCVFELISSRYKGGPAVIVYQRCPLDSPNSSFSAAALWEREPPTVMHFQEAFENHYPIADRANPMALIFPIALAHAAHFDYWDKHIFTFCTCTQWCPTAAPPAWLKCTQSVSVQSQHGVLAAEQTRIAVSVTTRLRAEHLSSPPSPALTSVTSNNHTALIRNHSR